MSIDQNLTRCVLEAEPDAFGAGRRMGPVPPTLISHPPLNINLIEKAWRASDEASHALLALGLPVHVDKSHGDATNRHFGSILHHAELPIVAKPLEEPEETEAEPHYTRNLEIRARRRHKAPLFSRPSYSRVRKKSSRLLTDLPKGAKVEYDGNLFPD